MTEQASSDHSRRVVTTLIVWIGLHVLLLVGVGLPGYAECRSGSAPQSGIFTCGSSLGVIALAIGWIQLIYGGVIALVLFVRKQMAIGQGVLIGMAAVTLLFTALCFGVAFGG